jgi:hypothetical protein
MFFTKIIIESVLYNKNYEVLSEEGNHEVLSDFLTHLHFGGRCSALSNEQLWLHLEKELFVEQQRNLCLCFIFYYITYFSLLIYASISYLKPSKCSSHFDYECFLLFSR